MNKNIIIAGGDGFCGWPLSLRLSKLGYSVTILDNFSRRKIDRELSANSITPIKDIYRRIHTWKRISKKKIQFIKIDLFKDTSKINNIVKKLKPRAIFMFAELKSAPYSMISVEHANKNFCNNLVSNNNLLNAIKLFSKNSHYIHLGTMGVYGYDYSKKILPEGYFKAKLINGNGEQIVDQILHPASPGSIYHLTKAQDELIFQFYNKMYGIKITDLHQGIVWGCNTTETSLHSNLCNRFDYDHIYGTFLNRLVAQAASKHALTLHGTGNQLRPFINIGSAIQSFVKILQNPPKEKKVAIFNELGEVKRLKSIAGLIADKYEVRTNNIDNPRKESEDNHLKAEATKLKKLGVKMDPITINKIDELYKLAVKYKRRIKKNKIINNVFW